MSEQERVFQECRKLGEQVVRQKIKDGTFNRLKRTYAEDWLERESLLRMEDSNSEQMRVTRSAKNAAWAAAMAAIIAAIATAVMAYFAFVASP